jgi:hypothetical protein
VLDEPIASNLHRCCVRGDFHRYFPVREAVREFCPRRSHANKLSENENLPDRSDKEIVTSQILGCKGRPEGRLKRKRRDKWCRFKEEGRSEGRKQDAKMDIPDLTANSEKKEEFPGFMFSCSLGTPFPRSALFLLTVLWKTRFSTRVLKANVLGNRTAQMGQFP